MAKTTNTTDPIQSAREALHEATERCRKAAFDVDQAQVAFRQAVEAAEARKPKKGTDADLSRPESNV